MRAERPVVWLTGVSGAGKTTLARMLEEHIELLGIPVDVLDGDEARAFFEADLGFSRSERVANVRRIAYAARKLADNGVFTIVASIAPYAEVRAFVRRKMARYVEVYVRAGLTTVRDRDVKGLYAQFDAGRMENVIGQDDQYDEPTDPDVVVDTDQETAQESLMKIRETLAAKGMI